MFLDQLVPRNKYLEYIPSFVNDDSVTPEAISGIAPFLNDQGMSLYQVLGFISGASDLQRIPLKRRGEDISDDASKSWFSTTEVVETRVFFRSSNHNPDRAIGSMVRLYSMGAPYTGKKSGNRNVPEEVQAIDSGFLRFNGGNKETAMVFQNALASTMFYNSVYCIGGPASVRKVNVVADDDSQAPSYKWLSAISPKWSDTIDRRSYEHILHPALDAAGVERDFFATETLDDLVRVFLDSTDMKDVETKLLNLEGEELDPQLVKGLIEHSNSPEANLSGSNDFYSAPGLNLVATLGYLCDNLAGDE